MKVRPSALLPILRSDATGDVLARLYLDPGQRWTVTALASATSVSVPTVTRELDRMVAAGMVTEERVGRTRQVSANSDTSLFAPLRELVLRTYGPVPVLEDELSDVHGVEQAFIYGSWAARRQGAEGPELHDVDVLIVGAPDSDDLFDAAERARRRLGRPVSIRRVSREAWEVHNPKDPFLVQVKASPLVALTLGREL